MDKYGMEPEDALDEIVEALRKQPGLEKLETEDILKYLEDQDSLDDADMFESAELSRVKELAGLSD